MRIVDPHFHIWDLDNLPYPWLTTDPPMGVSGDNSAIRKTYSLAAYLGDSDEFEIAKSVHVEAAVGPGQAVDETAWLDEVADLGGQPDGIVAFCDLSSPEAEVTLDAHQASGRVRGIRQILNTHQDQRLNFASQEFMENPRWIAGFELLAARDLSFDLQIYPGQMAAAAKLAQQHADTTIILNHTGMPTGHDRASFDVWRGAMACLERCNNVSVKISGLGMMFHKWTQAMIRPFVLETIALFDPSRCMFASNFPVDGMFSTFDVLWSAYRNIVSDLSTDEQEMLFGRTAERVYRI